MADPIGLGAEGTGLPPLLELNDASVVLGGTRVLDRLTLSIRVGEHTAILGPNGAGKSTFIKLLTLQQYPAVEDESPTTERDPSTSSGSARAPSRAEGFSRAASIRVFGQERWDVFELRSKLGIVSADLHDRFVHGNSNGVLTGLDAVVSGFFATHGLFRHQRVTDAMRRQAMEALERVDAARLAHATLDTMSTGEARRVLIARALVHQPAALVLDEPTRDSTWSRATISWSGSARWRGRGRRSCWSRITSTRSSRRSTGSCCCGAAASTGTAPSPKS